MASKKPAAASAAAAPAAQSSRVRLSVRISPAHAAAAGVPLRRYRAGLGPFTREPVTLEVEAWQAELLRADPALAVTEVGG